MFTSLCWREAADMGVEKKLLGTPDQAVNFLNNLRKVLSIISSPF